MMGHFKSNGVTQLHWYTVLTNLFFIIKMGRKTVKKARFNVDVSIT